MGDRNQELERRAEPRVQVTARVHMASGDTFFYTRDLSASGLFLLCEPLFADGELLRIAIALPGLRQLIEVEGRVVRRVTEGDTGVGVQFVNIPDAFRLLLKEELAQLGATPTIK